MAREQRADLVHRGHRARLEAPVREFIAHPIIDPLPGRRLDRGQASIGAYQIARNPASKSSDSQPKP